METKKAPKPEASKVERVSAALEPFIDEAIIARGELPDAAKAAIAAMNKPAQVDEGRTAWADKEDEHSPAIEAAYLDTNRDHELYALAFNMVSNRHSKFALVHLVYWLLTQRAMKPVSSVLLDEIYQLATKIATVKSAGLIKDMVEDASMRSDARQIIRLIDNARPIKQEPG